MTQKETFSTKELLSETRNVPSDTACKTCYPHGEEPPVNIAETNEVFLSLPQLLFITVNSWETVPPFLKKKQNVRATPTILVGDREGD